MYFHGNAVNGRSAQAKTTGRHLELRDYLGILTKHWLIVAASVLTGLILGVAATSLMTPKYEATTTLYVSVRVADSYGTEGLLNGTNFAQASMVSFADVATTTLVLDEVVEELGLDMGSSQLAQSLEVVAPTDSVLLKITATHEHPELAAAIADTTGEVFTRAVENELEFSADGSTSPVQVRTVDSAVVPDQPVTLSPLMGSILGFWVGLIAGIGLAVLRYFADTRIHSVRSLERFTGIPVIGRIPEDDNISHRPLIVHDDPQSQRAEAYRILRTNLQFLGAGEDHKTFMVSSAMPGEGKTHVAANLAIVLAESGARVTLVDADLRRPRLAHVMGIEGAAGLSDALIGRAELSDVLQPWGLHNLSVLPAGQRPPNPSELLGSQGMEELMKALQTDADYVIIDSLPILPVTDAAVISSLASGTLLVAALGQTKWAELDQAVERLIALDDHPLGIIANRVQSQSHHAYGSRYDAQHGEPVRATP